MIPEYLSAKWATIAPTIANHLWQSTLFTIAAAILTLALRKNQARVRHGIWLAASVKFLIPFSLLISLGSLLARPQGRAETQTDLYSAVQVVSQPFSPTAARIIPPEARTTKTAHLLFLLPEVLAGAWLCGFVAVISFWWLRWRRVSVAMRSAVPISQGREVDTLRRLERVAGVRKPIAFLVSRDSLEPGIFGIVRPSLIWPVGISEYLQNTHLEALLAHEVWHVRRRDNLAASIHMLVGAIFWFHPLVWWLGARLVEERERACDEEVLQLGNEPEVYAESILKTCEFCVGSPLTCVSGVTGADLKKRIVRIMTERVALKLDLSRKLLLVAAGLLAVVVPILFGQITAAQSGIESQSTNETANQLTFDVASIKLNKSGSGQITFGFGPSGSDRFRAKNVPLLLLIEWAYGFGGFSNDRITGAPEWAKSDRYDIEAKLADTDVDTLRKLTPEQRMLLLKPLLVDRCKLHVHRETKLLPVYALVIAKNGPKLKEAKPGDTYPNGIKGPDGRSRAGTFFMGAGRLTSQALPMAQLAQMLSTQVGRNVVDKTGLAGKYDFTLRWMPEEGQGPGAAQPGAAPPPESPGPSIFTALEEQLGLKLESQKGPVDFLVIDHVERPSPN